MKKAKVACEDPEVRVYQWIRFQIFQGLGIAALKSEFMFPHAPCAVYVRCVDSSHRLANKDTQGETGVNQRGMKSLYQVHM